MKNGIQSLHMGCAVTLLVALLLFLGMLAIGRFQQWRWRGRTEGAEVAIRATETHTQEELQQAVNVVLEEFEAFYGCTLNRLWYDEAIAAPLEQEQAKARELEDGDVLVLLADFQSGKKRDYPWFEPNTHYVDYCFLLVRDGNGWRSVYSEALTPPETTYEIVTPTPEPTS